MDDTFKRASLKTSEARELDAQAKATGTQIMFVDDLVDESGERVNAEYSDGVLRISLKAKNPVQVAMTHEIVHRLREIAPEKYYSLAQHVGKNMSKYFYDIAYDETSGVYKNSDIREEIVADAFGTIMGDKGKLESFVQDNRGAWQKIKDIIHDLIISIKRALHKNSQAKLTEKQRFVFGELLAKYEEMENVLNDALERTFEKVSSMTNEGASEIVEGRGETDVEKRGEAEYNDVKYSRKAKRGRSVELETMENNRFERIRQFHEDLPSQWYAFTESYFYLYVNHSQTEYTILLRASITARTKSAIDYFVRSVENGFHRNGNLFNGWLNHFRRGRGRYSWNPLGVANRGSTGSTNRVVGGTSGNSGQASASNVGNLGASSPNSQRNQVTPSKTNPNNPAVGRMIVRNLWQIVTPRLSVPPQIVRTAQKHP